MSNEIQWWGYKHIAGTYQVKPYFEARDIMEANDSDFCETVVGPFPAKDRDEALHILQNLITSMNDSVPTETEKRLYYWQVNGSNSFTSTLFKCIMHADSINQWKLSLGFPEEVEVAKRYMNEPGYWENLLQRIKKHGV